MGLKQALRNILKYGLPLIAAGRIMAALGQYYNFLIAVYANPKDIGSYSAAGAISAAIGYLSFPIETVMFPIFSKIDPRKKPKILNLNYRATRAVCIHAIKVVLKK